MLKATKDRRPAKSYSLRSTQHQALRAVADALAPEDEEGNASELLGEIVEAWLRDSLGPGWRKDLEAAVAEYVAELEGRAA